MLTITKLPEKFINAEVCCRAPVQLRWHSWAVSLLGWPLASSKKHILTFGPVPSWALQGRDKERRHKDLVGIVLLITRSQSWCSWRGHFVVSWARGGFFPKTGSGYLVGKAFPCFSQAEEGSEPKLPMCQVHGLEQTTEKSPEGVQFSCLLNDHVWHQLEQSL